MPRAVASSAALATRSTLRRSTPGMESTARRLPRPSVTKIGQIRSAAVSTFSATRRRDQGDLRLRRMRTVGNRPVSASGGAGSAARPSGSMRRGARGLASDFMGHLCLAGWLGGCTRHCGHARGQGKGAATLAAPRAALFAHLGVADAFGEIDVEVVAVGVVGLGAERGLERLAGRAVDGAEE